MPPSPLVIAAPSLAAVPFTASFVSVVRNVIGHEASVDGRALMATAASEGDLIQRIAGAIRLRLLSRRLPGTAGELSPLAELLAAKR